MKHTAHLLLSTLILLALPDVFAAEPASKEKAKSSPAQETKKTDTGKEKSKTKATATAEDKAATAPASADDAELKKAEALLKELPAAKKASFKKLLNSGKKEALTALPGIGEASADAIIKARPLESAAHLILVNGIGETTFADIVKSLK